MGFGIYEAKRLVRTPLVWTGRRRNADAPEAARWFLEHNAYRRTAQTAMANIAVDPYFFHRADLDADAVVIDVGAFRGEVAQEFVDLYDCRIHAYEPNPWFINDLERRFVDNPKVTTYPVGLGGSDAVLAMEQRGLGSTVYGKNDDASVPTVDVRIRDIATVLDELGHDRLDYVKINIEGAEYDLLDRMIESGWITRVRYLLIQFHEWYDDAHVRRWKIRRELRRTHEQVWNFPWIYELWCATDQPHPPPLEFSKAEREEIRIALREQIAQRAAGGGA